jgi:hypothetical protein
MPSRIRYAYSQPKPSHFLGRNHAGRPRHRLVRAEGTRLGLAGADARQPDASATVADERGDVRRWPQDHPPPRDREESVGAKEHGEALHRSAQNKSEALDRETLYREALDREARGPEDRSALDQIATLDRQADQQALDA